METSKIGSSKTGFAFLHPSLKAKFARYAEVPMMTAEKIIAAYKATVNE